MEHIPALQQRLCQTRQGNSGAHLAPDDGSACSAGPTFCLFFLVRVSRAVKRLPSGSLADNAVPEVSTQLDQRLYRKIIAGGLTACSVFNHCAYHLCFASPEEEEMCPGKDHVALYDILVQKVRSYVRILPHFPPYAWPLVVCQPVRVQKQQTLNGGHDQPAGGQEGPGSDKTSVQRIGGLSTQAV
jgi:hypothetical protein